MILVTPDIRAALRANDAARSEAIANGLRAPDPVPVVRFFNPLGQATWLATEIDADGILFGLADLGFGSPALGRTQWRATSRRRGERLASPALLQISPALVAAIQCRGLGL